jgi:YVTN family beta-propeller protein
LAVGLLAAVPRLVRFSGVAKDASGNPVAGVAGITFALYSEQTGGAPLWMETQNVQAGPGGHYTVLLGATKSEGLPADLFTTAQARWVGIAVEGQAEQPRVLLVSAPYALKAGDAETLGGLPASAFLLAGPAVPAAAAAPGAKPETSLDVSPDTACTKITSDGTATANQVAKFTAACAIEPSAIFESGGKVGIGTTTPAATLDVKGTATLRGALTMNVQGAATAAAGADSNPLDLLAASFDSSTDTSISQHFRWQAEAAGNDTASPSGTLNLLYGQGGATPAETGLSVNSQGLLTFGADQTFPGVGTITGVTAGGGLAGGGTTGTVTLGLTHACASGQVLQWNGSKWACATPAAGTITGVTAGVGLSGGGTSGAVTLTNTGVLAVAGGTGITSSGGSAPTVSLNTGYTDGRYLQLTGGTLSGPLNLPANGLTTANNQLVLAGGNVGIDTATPGAPLEVAGNMKISGAGSTLTFPDGSTQSTAAGPAGVAAANPLQVALLRWFPADQSVTLTVGTNPNGIAFDGADIWVANFSSSTVSKVQASTGLVIGAVTVGSGPSAVAFDGANIWVTNQKSTTVSKVRASDGGCVGTCTFAVGTGPNGIAFDGTNIWVTNEYSNNVTKLLASTGALVNTYNVGNRPQGIAFDGTNIWVANEGDGTVSKLSSTGAPLSTVTVGSGPFGVAFDGTNIWVANYYSNSVTKILAATATVVNTYGVGANPYGVAFDGTNIWVSNSGSGTVTKLLASTGAPLGTFTVGSSPYGVAFDGADIWVANWTSGTVSKL